MKAGYNTFIVKIDKKFEDEIKTESGLVLYKDTTFKPEENSATRGVVVSAPDTIFNVGGVKGVYDVREGDILYFHYGVVLDDYNDLGDNLWAVDAFNAIARSRSETILEVFTQTEVKPCGEYILIRPINDEIATSLHIPDTFNKEGTRGEIVASNDEACPAGTIVKYERKGKFWNMIEGEKLYCALERNILAIYEPNKKKANKKRKVKDQANS